jgi:MoaA/NifB/PqqE/SkfB family radical SAM enzyme
MEFIDKALFVKDLVSARLSRPKPLVTHINITNKCNLQCAYCYASYPDKQIDKDIPTEKWINLISQLRKLGARRINIGGGEPLVRKDIGAILDHIRKNHILVNMNTNGHLVKEMMAVVKKLTTCCISIDGDEQIHDKRKGIGSYKKVIEAIKTAKENGVVVHTSTLISRDNIHAILSVLEVAKKYGCMAEFLLPFLQKADPLLPSAEDIRDLFHRFIDYKKQGYPISMSYETINHILNWPDYTMLYRTDVSKNACCAGKFMCIMDYDGYVYPCSLLVANPLFKPLNFLEVGFKKAFENTINHQCKSCYAFTSFNDYNMMLDWNPKVYLNYFKNSLLESKWKK